VAALCPFSVAFFPPQWSNTIRIDEIHRVTGRTCGETRPLMPVLHWSKPTITQTMSDFHNCVQKKKEETKKIHLFYIERLMAGIARGRLSEERKV